MRTARAGWLTGLALGAAACGGDYGGALADASEFCRSARACVDAFIGRMEQEHPAPDSERYGGTVAIGSIGDIADGMNGFISQDYSASQHQQCVNMMTLIGYDEQLRPHPYLA